jgi:hypothetical protein
MPGVRSVEIGETVGVGTRFKWKAGPGAITSQVIEWDPPKAVGWKGRTLGIDAIHAWRIEGDGQESRVVTEESWSGFLARPLRAPTRKTVRKALDAKRRRHRGRSGRPSGNPPQRPRHTDSAISALT